MRGCEIGCGECARDDIQSAALCYRLSHVYRRRCGPAMRRWLRQPRSTALSWSCGRRRPTMSRRPQPSGSSAARNCRRRYAGAPAGLRFGVTA